MSKDTTSQHMMRLYYALVNFTSPQPDDDPEEVMAQAKEAIEQFHNDATQWVTIDLSEEDLSQETTE